MPVWRSDTPSVVLKWYIRKPKSPNFTLNLPEVQVESPLFVHPPEAA